jgi:hypothetical protein
VGRGKLERLSRILGHSSIGVTEAYYAHLDLTDLAEDADLVMVVRRWEEGPEETIRTDPPAGAA